MISAILDASQVECDNPVLFYHQFNNTISMLMEKSYNKNAFPCLHPIHISVAPAKLPKAALRLLWKHLVASPQ